jgi:predicted nucleotidyltransferase
MEKQLVIQLLKKFKNTNKNKYSIETIGLFGSVSRDEAVSFSDVDICIKADEADLFTLVHIKEDLEELLSSPVDLVKMHNKMNPFLKKRIEAEVIYV